MIRLSSPIPDRFMNKHRFCQITQLYGENKNKLFYGAKGHQGIDFRTKGAIKYLFHRIKKYILKPKSLKERIGNIPIQASHDGYLLNDFNEDIINGIYIKLLSTCGNYITTYFHLDSIRVWKDDNITTGHEKIQGKNFVKKGSVIGYGGNTGKYTTGAHLHFSLRQKIKDGWELINPMPYFQDDIVYQRNDKSYYKGKLLTVKELKNI